MFTFKVCGVQESGPTARQWALATVSATALAFAGLPGAAQAAESQPAQTAQAPAVEEIVVTGSRIVRDGFSAPTPVSVFGAQELAAAAPTNMADFVSAIPSFTNGPSSRNTRQSIGPGTSGISNLNLRGLGPTRTLVLLDGQRVVGATLGSSDNGSAVDINEFPDSLVSRVDVVTGGASAAYGSDALSGVVNFVLDHDYVGVKGNIQAGVTTYGDDRNMKLSLTGGTLFGNGRGHFLINGDYTHNAGIEGLHRPWNQSSTQVITNPAYTATNGQPQLIIREHVSRLDGIPGGIITAGPLKGIAFGPGGVPRQFNYGSITNTQSMVGGDWESSRIDIFSDMDGKITRTSVFTRASYDVGEETTVFAVAQYGDSKSFANCCSQFSFANITIKADNAFLPAPVAAQMAALKLTQFTMGNTNPDMPLITGQNRRTFTRFVVGANGKFDAVGTNWTWNAYFQESHNHLANNAPQDRITIKYNEAVDAVRAPSGAIVCRSTLTNPTNGCVPYNAMGIGVNGPAVINYVTGPGHLNTNMTQDVASADMAGEPFSSWAGPVSLSFGAEWRREGVIAKSTPTDEANLYFVGNYHGTIGHYTVAEGFVETLVPLAADTVWAKSLELNAAIRATSYSESGYVTTWKVGATYAPIDDLKFRATRSRDIRAPTLGDLFAGGTSTNGPQFDPFTNTTAQLSNIITGNPNLRPEKADTTGAGVVVQPVFFPGFSASFDYFNINIRDAITSLRNTDYINRCFAGQLELCSALNRNAQGVLFRIDIKPANVLQQVESGYDIEASYTTPLSAINNDWDGSVGLRFLATRITRLNTTDNAGGVITVVRGAGVLSPVSVGRPSAPDWRWVTALHYANGPLTWDLSGRYIGAGKYSNEYLECASGCPAATPTLNTIDNNRIDGHLTFDLALNYKVFEDGAHNVETFFVVTNLANKAPPLVAANGSLAYLAGNSIGLIYDLVGRTFRAGVRFKM